MLEALKKHKDRMEAQMMDFIGVEKHRIEKVFSAGFEEGQKDGYNKGLNEGISRSKSYWDGVDYAWEEAARVLLPSYEGGYSGSEIMDIFGGNYDETPLRILKDLTGVEAIDKINAWKARRQEAKEGGNKMMGITCFLENHESENNKDYPKIEVSSTDKLDMVYLVLCGVSVLVSRSELLKALDACSDVPFG